MTHPYDDYEVCLSDTWDEMLRQADDGLGEWMSQLLRDSLPSEWKDSYLPRMDEDILERPEELLLDLLMRRHAGSGMTQRERDIQRIGMKIVLNPFDRAENDRRLAILASAVASGAEVRNPAAGGGQHSQVAPFPYPRSPRG